jgi:hypothetical protein
MAHIPFEPTIAGSQAPPPYECTGVKAFGFPLLADAPPLQALCDQFLSIAPPSAGISFEPIQVAPNTCSITLEALDYESLRPTTSPWVDLGETPQRELLFAVPVVRKQNGVPVEAGVFIPYIFVDDLGSALTGREVLGLPKVLARFSLDRNFPASDPIVMRFKGRKSVSAPAQEKQIVKIAALPGTVVLPSLGAAINMFLGPLNALFAGSAAFGLIAAAQAAGSTVGFSTRMLIEPNSSTTDAFRSIMRSTYTTTIIRASGSLTPVSVTLSSLVALDIQSTLGIRPGPGGKIPSLNPFFLDFDFQLGGLTTVWQS